VETCSDMQYVPRNHYLISLGRTSLESKTHKDAIENLTKGPLYNRLLALQTINGSRDTELLLNLFANDPSRTLQIRARKLVAAYAPDDGIIQASKNVGPKILTYLIRQLKNKHRQNVIDKILESLRASNESLFMKLLPYASEALVSDVLKDPVGQVSVVPNVWIRYAKILPKVAYRACAEQIKKGYSWATIYHVYVMLDQCLPWFCRANPGELDEDQTPVNLVRILLGMSFVGMNDRGFPDLQCVVDKYPREMLQLLLARNERVVYEWHRRGYEILSVEELHALYNHTPSAINGQTLRGFLKIPKEKRVAVFKMAENHWRQNDGSISIITVRNLPTKEREEEARRQLYLECNEAKPLQKMEAAALLPWDEGMEANKQYIQNNDIEQRAPALKSQIWGVRYQRRRFQDALELVTKRPYDNDVVRQAMLSALASLPQVIWKEEHLQSLKAIYSHSFDAADLSVSSQESLWKLGVKLLPNYPKQVSPLMAKLVNESRVRNSNWGSLDRSIPSVALSHLENALMPTLKLYMKRKDVTAVRLIGRFFHEVLDRVPQILNLLEEAAMEERFDFVWITLRAIKRHKPERIAGMVQQMLDDDPSKVLLGDMDNYLTRCKPSLLDRYIVEFGYKGAHSNGQLQIRRFWKGKGTWTARQQELYAKTLAKASRERIYADGDVQDYVRLLAELPYSENADAVLKELAALKENRIAVRDTAIRALGRVDEGKGIAFLLDALDDERARIAIYALRSILFKNFSPHGALEILKDVKSKKITVQKEVIRLIGDLNTTEALEYLVEKERDTTLHVDIRCALLRRLWNLDDSDENRLTAIFEGNVSQKNPVILKTIATFNCFATIPGQGISIDRRELLTSLIAKLVSYPDAEVQQAVLQRLQDDPFPLEDERYYEYEEGEDESSSSVLRLALESMIVTMRKKPEMLDLACRAYFQNFIGTSSPKSLQRPGSAVAKLFDTILEKRDYHTLSLVFQAFNSSTLTFQFLNDEDAKSAAREVFDVLERDGYCQKLCVKLIFNMTGVDLHPRLLRIAPALHADALVEAENLFGVLIFSPPKDLHFQGLERELSSSKDEKSRRLGLAALAQLGRTVEGWTEERRNLLEEYKRDESCLVREAANFVFPPEKMEEGEEDQKAKRGVSKGRGDASRGRGGVSRGRGGPSTRGGSSTGRGGVSMGRGG